MSNVIQKEMPPQAYPNAIHYLWEETGKSSEQISAEIQEQFGVLIHGSAIRRASLFDTGIRKDKLEILAKYFGVNVWELRNPHCRKKSKKFLPNRS